MELDENPPLSSFLPCAHRPALDIIQGERSLDGVQISENGTLRVNLRDGVEVAVRPDGSSIEKGGLVEDRPIQKSDTHKKDQALPVVFGRACLEDFKIGPIIGEGNQAKVRKVKHRVSGKMYALKCIPISKDISRRTLQQELSFVLLPNHPNIVEAVDAFYAKGSLKLLMEFMDMGTLKTLIETVGPLPNGSLPCVIGQLLSGLGWLHSSNTIHRDIKPSNVLLNSSGVVKIADFGISTFLDSNHPYAYSQVGSTAYMSPERVRGNSYDKRSDIWGIGLIAAQCGLGRYPFYTGVDDMDPNDNPFERKVNTFELATLVADFQAYVDFDALVPLIRKFYPSLPVPNITMELKDFVWKCMKQNSIDRPLCDELIQHPLMNYPSIDFGHWIRQNYKYKKPFEYSSPKTKDCELQSIP